MQPNVCRTRLENKTSERIKLPYLFFKKLYQATLTRYRTVPSPGGCQVDSLICSSRDHVNCFYKILISCRKITVKYCLQTAESGSDLDIAPCRWCKKMGRLRNFSYHSDGGKVVYYEELCSTACFEGVKKVRQGIADVAGSSVGTHLYKLKCVKKNRCVKLKNSLLIHEENSNEINISLIFNVILTYFLTS